MAAHILKAPRLCPRDGGTLQAPLWPAQACSERIEPQQGNHKGKTREIRKETVAGPSSSFAEAMNEGVGETAVVPHPRTHPSASTLRSSSRSQRFSAPIPTPRPPRPQPGPAFSPTWWRGSLVSTAWLHLPSARKSRSVKRLFPLPASFRASVDRIVSIHRRVNLLHSFLVTDCVLNEVHARRRQESPEWR